VRNLLLAGVGLLALLGTVLLTGSWTSGRSVPVAATAETEPVITEGDAADDAAFWIHPRDPSGSRIIATDKNLGLVVYDLAGRRIQVVRGSRPNNVDVRDGFPLGGRRVALVTAGRRGDGTIGIYRVIPETGRLEGVAARRIATVPPYGSCMYHSRASDRFYYFVNSKAGEPRLEQWQLFDDGGGRVDARRVRSFALGAAAEGCVADDELGHLYLGIQSQGIRKYGAEPGAGSAYRVVDRSAPEGHLFGQVEGLALYAVEQGRGFLIASSQGSDDYTVYAREGENAYRGAFRIVAGTGVDAVNHTDGIDVVASDLGPDFPAGVFIAQDHENPGGNQNFKLVAWRQVDEALELTPK
jgi:3-phytase